MSPSGTLDMPSRQPDVTSSQGWLGETRRLRAGPPAKRPTYCTYSLRPIDDVRDRVYRSDKLDALGGGVLENILLRSTSVRHWWLATCHG